jgi:SOS response regulatory protein OraA/RecX
LPRLKLTQTEFDTALDAALRKLRLKERFEGELREYLTSQLYAREVVDAVLDHLKARGLQSDRRALEYFLQRHSNLGRDRIIQQLRQLEVDPDLYEPMLADELERAVAALMHQRFTEKDSLKAARFLVRRGFEVDIVRAAVFKTLGVELPG